MHQVLQPPGWARPKGYVNGIVASGRMVFIAGQVGWNAAEQFESDDFVDQARQALRNIVAVLAEAEVGPVLGGDRGAAHRRDCRRTAPERCERREQQSELSPPHGSVRSLTLGFRGSFASGGASRPPGPSMKSAIKS